MNRLNPIYILALVFTLFIISIVLFNDKKNEFKSLNSQLSSFQLKIENFKEYKKTWFNENKTINKIDSILRNPVFQKEKILRTQTKGLIKIKIESSNPRILSRFLNRFLNETLIIKRLNVQKSSISMDIEVKWWSFFLDW